jgi:hypothetical protein
MTDINCKNFLGMLKGDFGALWHCKQLGNTIEITTPYLYPDNSFVSIFITKRSNRFVVSDAGHASEFFKSAKDDEPFFASLIAKARLVHNVSEYKQGDRTFYLKETKDIKLVSSIAFDVASFLVASSNAAELAIAEDDSGDKNSFRARADKYIKPQITRGRTVKFNQKIPEIKEATFSAVITEASKLLIVIYLTGSNLKYFQLSVANAIFNVESANHSSIHGHIKGIYPLVDDDALGYQPRHLNQRLGKLTAVAKSKVILWRQKEELTKQLMAA